jgi:phosphohistidine phosphatase
MKLYLVQHGEALPGEIDAERPLSARGRADVERTAAMLKAAQLGVSRVLHSGKNRARQTAELFAAALAPQSGSEAIDGIMPMDGVDSFARTLAGWQEDAMVVGHLPFMAKLVSLLLCGDQEAMLCSYEPGSIVCLERTAQDRWSLAWMVRPALASMPAHQGVTE